MINFIKNRMIILMEMNYKSHKKITMMIMRKKKNYSMKKRGQTKKRE